MSLHSVYLQIIIFINVRAWIAGPVASDTPVNDLQLNKQIRQWRIANE